MGYKINPSESLINALGYNALHMKNLKLAGYFFKLNTDNYPTSFNAFDSMGDYHNATGNYEQAIEMYKKALSLYENEETRNKLTNTQKQLIQN